MSAQSLNKLKELLLAEGYTCVLEKDGKIFTSRERGIRPLIDWLDSGEDFRGGTAADKVVGKAAAFLYVRLGIRKLYAEVLAESGLSVLRAHAIEAEYGTLTLKIINREGTDQCPMEKTVASIDAPEEAEIALRNRLKTLR